MTSREKDILHGVLWRLHRSLYAAPNGDTANALCGVIEAFGDRRDWASTENLAQAVIEDAYRISGSMR